ncbi:MAG: anti-sigma factor [Dehalococcoidia bacterium]|nr:anti-sigma factor [Dehalococcoidia bacterium]
MWRRVLAAIAFCAIAVGAVVGAGDEAARANGVPQLVKLTYLDGVSNFGPTAAEGVLEFSFAEAYARVEVKNLPPQSGYTYEGWMVAPDGSAVSIGTIEVQESGVGTYETKIEGLDRYDYSLFLIAARSASTAADAVPAERSIAGRFTIIADGTATGGDVGNVRPATLPETGEAAPGRDYSRYVWTGISMAGAAIVIFGARRQLRRRQP